MSRFCKTCRFMKGDREARRAECHYWPHFSATAPIPAKGAFQPTFRPTLLTPRLIWDDLPTPPELAALGLDHGKEPLSESMDCPVWEDAQ
jgi:hypothetical protein